MIKHYDIENKSLTLITEVKGNEAKDIKTKTYQYPPFVNGSFVKRAVDIGAEFEENGQILPSGLFDKFTNYIVELYGKQFNANELISGLAAEKVVETYVSIVMSVLSGNPSKKEKSIKVVK